MLRWISVAIATVMLTLTGGPVSAETTPVPGSASAPTGADATVSVPVPDGVVPEAVIGRLTLDEDIAGEVTILAGGRTALTVPAASRSRVRIPVGADDVDESGRIELTVRVRPEASGAASELAPICRDSPDVTATLDRIRLRFSGTETAPTTVADFLPSFSPRVDVVLDAEPTDAELAAALGAVAALAERYPAATAVSLRSASDETAPPPPGTRVVRISESDADLTAVIGDESGVPTLTVDGRAEALAAAAAALGSDELVLADDASVTGLALQRKTLRRTSTASLSDLGTTSLRLEGYGRVERYVEVNQDAFGSPLSGIDLHLVGRHTALPAGARAQLDVRVNDRLVDSVALGTAETGADTAIDRRIEVPGSALRAVNGVVVSLSATPAREDCAARRQLPLQVDFDTTASTVTAQPGGGVRGLAAFPTVLGGELPVALGSAVEPADRLAAAADAADLVAALQRQAARPLTVSLVSADELLDGDASGLLVGADGDDTRTVKAPLRLDAMRLLDYAEATFQVEAAAPYAALQAVDRGGRRLLVLGGWAPDGSDATDLRHRLTREVARIGWNALADDLFLATSADQPPFSLDSNAVVPQRERVDEQRSYAWWLVGALAVLVALVILRWLLARRRRRSIETLVDETIAAQRTDGQGRDRDDADDS